MTLNICISLLENSDLLMFDYFLLQKVLPINQTNKQTKNISHYPLQRHQVIQCLS